MFVVFILNITFWDPNLCFCVVCVSLICLLILIIPALSCLLFQVSPDYPYVSHLCPISPAPLLLYINPPLPHCCAWLVLKVSSLRLVCCVVCCAEWFNCYLLYEPDCALPDLSQCLHFLSSWTFVLLNVFCDIFQSGPRENTGSMSVLYNKIRDRIK